MHITSTYSGVSNNHTLCFYLFPRKILPCAFISPLLNSTMDALCVYCFWKNTLPCVLIPYSGIIRYSRVLTFNWHSCYTNVLSYEPQKDGATKASLKLVQQKFRSLTNFSNTLETEFHSFQNFCFTNFQADLCTYKSTFE